MFEFEADSLNIYSINLHNLVNLFIYLARYGKYLRLGCRPCISCITKNLHLNIFFTHFLEFAFS